MPEVTEESLEKLAAANQRKREQIAVARAERLSNEQKVSNEISLAKIQQEGEALDAELAYERDRAKISTVRAGVDLDAIKQQMTATVVESDDGKGAK